MLPVALTIAGSDPSGGAGLQADLKTFHQHGVYGAAAVTLLTVQNTRGVSRVEILDAGLVSEQLQAVLADLPPAAAKTGALGNAGVIRAVAAGAERLGCPLVVDPVMISKHGAALLAEEGVAALREALLPRALLITPNIPEAEALSGMSIRDARDLERAAAAMAAFGPRHVLVKGGHLPGPPIDLLWSDGRVSLRRRFERVDTRHTHGTGCVLSAAITARLARGEPLADAVSRAADFVQRAIRSAPGLGGGHGPLNLHEPADPI